MIRRRTLALLLSFLGWLAATPASAAWLEARSTHFIIDADTSESRLREFATRLERFDSALRRVYGASDDPGRRANRLLVFAVDDATVARLCRGCPATVMGFYTKHAGGSAVLTSALGAIAAGSLTPQAVLLHEYGHHFMFSEAPGAYPLWYAEGFAEFNANAEFRPDGGIVLGLPAQYRAYGLTHDLSGADTGSLFAVGSRTLTVAQLMDPPKEMGRHDSDLDQFYGRSWLLMHYLQLTPARRVQLADYAARVSRGEGSLAAARTAFGDLGRLNAELARYLSTNRLLPPLLVPPTPATPPIEIAPLSPGAAAMMPAHMRSAVGTTREEAKAALPSVAARAAPFPADPRVQVELAEAAYDAGDDATAIHAADRALAADPADADALLFKGKALVRQAIAAGGTPEALAAARAWLVKANRVAPDAARTLLAYYRSFVDAGHPASPAAVNGLLRAAVVAGEDPGVRWLLARQMLEQGDAPAARAVLLPLLGDPHAGAAATPPRQVVERIDARDLAGARALLAKLDLGAES